MSLKIIWKSAKENFSQRYRINIISIFTMLLISGRDSVDAKSFYKESQIPIIEIRLIIPSRAAVEKAQSSLLTGEKRVSILPSAYNSVIAISISSFKLSAKEGLRAKATGNENFVI